MAEMVPVTITGVVSATDRGPEPCERFFIELAAEADGDSRRLRIGVGDAEAGALALRLQGTVMPRPMTYQLTAALVEAAGSAVRSVRVTRWDGAVFYAQVMLRGGALVDARPSDAINLAAVTGAPVFVAADLFGVGAGLLEPGSAALGPGFGVVRCYVLRLGRVWRGSSRPLDGASLARAARRSRGLAR
jgi:bifunctional DNase/RNase